MKQFLFLIVLVSMGNLLPAQVLFTYGKHQVDKDEFLRAYHKNNPSGGNEQSLREYLDLFIAFKLKVQAARDRKMDTLPQQKRDLLSFRQQIETDYMTDRVIIHDLAVEAFQRSQVNIRLSHIFIPFDAGYLSGSYAPASPDTMAAFEKIQQAYAELRNGRDFSAIAEKYSSDPEVKKNKGDIGFITVFSLPYALENIAYTLRDGTFSIPYKSKSGYHIIKRTGTRPAWGKMEAAQILLAYTPGASANEIRVQKKLADSLYRALQNGSDFSTLVKQFSSERDIHRTGGVIPEFGIGTYDPVFESRAFALEKDGDISQPFETSFGIHIVKRIRRIPVITDSTRSEDLFKGEVVQDARIAIARDRFTDRIIKETGFKKRFQQDAVLWRLTDTFLINNSMVSQKNITDHTVLFSFDKENITVKDWLGFIRSSQNNNTGLLPYPDMMKQFVAASAMAYYRLHLEDYNRDFRNQITEFSESNQLFGIMESEVWDKAAKDKKGLEAYYQQHREKYTWGPSANVIFFTTSDPETAGVIVKDINHYAAKWRTLEESSNGKIIADSTRLELDQIPGEKGHTRPGQITERITDPASRSTNFMYILSVNPQPAQRSFEEARGLVINDYQAVLEDKWLTTLKKKYPVKINEKLLQTLAE